MRSRAKEQRSPQGALEQPGGNGPTYAIGDLAREFGITHRTLRFYEDRRLLSPRREGMIRIYGADDHARLSLILKAKQLGFTLTDIRAMLVDEGRVTAEHGRSVALDLKLSLAQVEDQIAHLESQKADIEQALAELAAQRDALKGAA